MYKKNSTDYIARYLTSRLEAVLNAVPTAVSWTNLKDKKIIFLNKKFIEQFGYELGDHETVDDWIEQTYVNPEHVQRAKELWSEKFKSGKQGSLEIAPVEVDILCKDGSIKTSLNTGMIMPSEGWGLATFTDITESKESEARFERLALEDDLTRLGNRRAFKGMLDNCLSRAQRQNKYCALMLLDLDDFKSLNDTMGHDVGDIALQTIAERLKVSVRGVDFVCRLGGDEFAVIVDCVETVEIIEDLADRILKEIAIPIELEGKSKTLKLSIGIGLSEQGKVDAKALFKTADQALYRAKDTKLGCWSH